MITSCIQYTYASVSCTVQTSQMILSKCVILQKMTIVFYFLFCAQTCVIKSCRSTNTQRDSFDLATKTGTLVTHEEKLSFRGHWSLLEHSPGWHHILLVQSKGLHLWPPTIINHLCPKHQSVPIQSLMVGTSPYGPPSVISYHDHFSQLLV